MGLSNFAWHPPAALCQQACCGHKPVCLSVCLSISKQIDAFPTSTTCLVSKSAATGANLPIPAWPPAPTLASKGCGFRGAVKAEPGASPRTAAPHAVVLPHLFCAAPPSKSRTMSAGAAGLAYAGWSVSAAPPPSTQRGILAASSDRWSRFLSRHTHPRAARLLHPR
jgi:hypothetical protein